MYMFIRVHIYKIYTRIRRQATHAFNSMHDTNNTTTKNNLHDDSSIEYTCVLSCSCILSVCIVVVRARLQYKFNSLFYVMKKYRKGTTSSSPAYNVSLLSVASVHVYECVFIILLKTEMTLPTFSYP